MNPTVFFWTGFVILVVLATALLFVQWRLVIRDARNIGTQALFATVRRHPTLVLATLALIFGVVALTLGRTGPTADTVNPQLEGQPTGEQSATPDARRTAPGEAPDRVVPGNGETESPNIDSESMEDFREQIMNRPTPKEATP